MLSPFKSIWSSIRWYMLQNRGESHCPVSEQYNNGKYSTLLFPSHATTSGLKIHSYFMKVAWFHTVLVAIDIFNSSIQVWIPAFLGLVLLSTGLYRGIHKTLDTNFYLQHKLLSPVWLWTYFYCGGFFCLFIWFFVCFS